MKSKHYLMGIIIIIAIAGFFVLKSTMASDQSYVNSSGNIQEITLSYRDYNYYPQVISVNVNQPVRIYLDSNVKGCYRSFTIRDFNINKYIKTPTDYVQFTPNKVGTFTFACSMGMGTGKLIVK